MNWTPMPDRESRSIIREGIVRAMSHNQMSEIEDLEMDIDVNPEIIAAVDVFGQGDQVQDGWSMVFEIKCDQEWGQIWLHKEDTFGVVVFSDGGNENNLEFWE